MEELFYLKDTRTGKYQSHRGLVDSKEDAQKFTDEQIKRRYNIAKTHQNKLKEKLENGFIAMEPVIEKKKGLSIESDTPYQDDDVLFCEGVFYFEKNVVSKKVIYSCKRNILRIPEGGKGKLERTVLKVIKKMGKVNADQVKT